MIDSLLKCIEEAPAVRGDGLRCMASILENNIRLKMACQKICLKDSERPKSKLVLFIPALSLPIALLPARAQESPPKTYQMEEVKVVASPIIQGNQLDSYASQMPKGLP
jgi:hypothetical protein